jgi:ribonuclease HI
MKIELYTDGGCRGNGKVTNKGAWAYAIVQNGKVVHSNSEGKKDTTNNRMELQALIMGLTYCSSFYPKAEITAIVDSTYVMKGITDWIHTWEAKNWKTAKKEPVKNRELWVTLLALQDKLKIEYQWTKGHADNKFNNYVDDLCNVQINCL